eukprot:TRINITY_DN844_c2_g1_i10.p1 TRINITY_DN844_c2_g1~~TRINITY_DN844_c2_g1_i10.p1  ORF type:complete len:2295 (+),score=402.99 TRINITY_DN844_c2_g1_i10:4295-11179(+)
MPGLLQLVVACDTKILKLTPKIEGLDDNSKINNSFNDSWLIELECIASTTYALLAQALVRGGEVLPAEREVYDQAVVGSDLLAGGLDSEYAEQRSSIAAPMTLNPGFFTVLIEGSNSNDSDGNDPIARRLALWVDQSAQRGLPVPEPVVPLVNKAIRAIFAILVKGENLTEAAKAFGSVLLQADSASSAEKPTAPSVIASAMASANSLRLWAMQQQQKMLYAAIKQQEEAAKAREAERIKKAELERQRQEVRARHSKRRGMPVQASSRRISLNRAEGEPATDQPSPGISPVPTGPADSTTDTSSQGESQRAMRRLLLRQLQMERNNRDGDYDMAEEQLVSFASIQEEEQRSLAAALALSASETSEDSALSEEEEEEGSQPGPDILTPSTTTTTTTISNVTTTTPDSEDRKGKGRQDDNGDAATSSEEDKVPTREELYRQIAEQLLEGAHFLLCFSSTDRKAHNGMWDAKLARDIITFVQHPVPCEKLVGFIEARQQRADRRIKGMEAFQTVLGCASPTAIKLEVVKYLGRALRQGSASSVANVQTMGMPLGELRLHSEGEPWHSKARHYVRDLEGCSSEQVNRVRQVFLSLFNFLLSVLRDSGSKASDDVATGEKIMESKFKLMVLNTFALEYEVADFHCFATSPEFFDLLRALSSSSNVTSASVQLNHLSVDAVRNYQKKLIKAARNTFCLVATLVLQWPSTAKSEGDIAALQDEVLRMTFGELEQSPQAATGCATKVDTLALNDEYHHSLLALLYRLRRTAAICRYLSVPKNILNLISLLKSSDNSPRVKRLTSRLSREALLMSTPQNIPTWNTLSNSAMEVEATSSTSASGAEEVVEFFFELLNQLLAGEKYSQELTPSHEPATAAPVALAQCSSEDGTGNCYALIVHKQPGASSSDLLRVLPQALSGIDGPEVNIKDVTNELKTIDQAVVLRDATQKQCIKYAVLLASRNLSTTIVRQEPGIKFNEEVTAGKPQSLRNKQVDYSLAAEVITLLRRMTEKSDWQPLILAKIRAYLLSIPALYSEVQRQSKGKDRSIANDSPSAGQPDVSGDESDSGGSETFYRALAVVSLLGGWIDIPHIGGKVQYTPPRSSAASTTVASDSTPNASTEAAQQSSPEIGTVVAFRSQHVVKVLFEDSAIYRVLKVSEVKAVPDVQFPAKALALITSEMLETFHAFLVRTNAIFTPTQLLSPEFEGRLTPSLLCIAQLRARMVKLLSHVLLDKDTVMMCMRNEATSKLVPMLITELAVVDLADAKAHAKQQAEIERQQEMMTDNDTANTTTSKSHAQQSRAALSLSALEVKSFDLQEEIRAIKAYLARPTPTSATPQIEAEGDSGTDLGGESCDEEGEGHGGLEEGAAILSTLSSSDSVLPSTDSGPTSSPVDNAAQKQPQSPSGQSRTPGKKRGTSRQRERDRERIERYHQREHEREERAKERERQRDRRDTRGDRGDRDRAGDRDRERDRDRDRDRSQDISLLRGSSNRRSASKLLSTSTKGKERVIEEKDLPTVMSSDVPKITWNENSGYCLIFFGLDRYHVQYHGNNGDVLVYAQPSPTEMPDNFYFEVTVENDDSGSGVGVGLCPVSNLPGWGDCFFEYRGNTGNKCPPRKRRDDEVVYRCPFCDQEKLTAVELCQHTYRRHSGSSVPVVCPICANTPFGDPTYISSNFFGHMENSHGDQLYGSVPPSAEVQYGPAFTTGDVIGCGWSKMDGGIIYFTKNGKNLGPAFLDKDITDARLVPMVRLRSVGVEVNANFGNRPFLASNVAAGDNESLIKLKEEQEARLREIQEMEDAKIAAREEQAEMLISFVGLPKDFCVFALERNEDNLEQAASWAFENFEQWSNEQARVASALEQQSRRASETAASPAASSADGASPAASVVYAGYHGEAYAFVDDTRDQPPREIPPSALTINKLRPGLKCTVSDRAQDFTDNCGWVDQKLKTIGCTGIIRAVDLTRLVALLEFYDPERALKEEWWYPMQSLQLAANEEVEDDDHNSSNSKLSLLSLRSTELAETEVQLSSVYARNAIVSVLSNWHSDLPFLLPSLGGIMGLTGILHLVAKEHLCQPVPQLTLHNTVDQSTTFMRTLWDKLRELVVGGSGGSGEGADTAPDLVELLLESVTKLLRDASEFSLNKVVKDESQHPYDRTVDDQLKEIGVPGATGLIVTFDKHSRFSEADGLTIYLDSQATRPCRRFSGTNLAQFHPVVIAGDSFWLQLKRASSVLNNEPEWGYLVHVTPTSYTLNLAVWLAEFLAEEVKSPINVGGRVFAELVHYLLTIKSGPEVPKTRSLSCTRPICKA